MNRNIALVVASLFAIAVAPAALATPQTEKMKTCNAEAKTKDLKGDERKTFMKSCLSGGQAAEANPASAACASKAVGSNGKPLAGAAKTAFMKKCEKDAAEAK